MNGLEYFEMHIFATEKVYRPELGFAVSTEVLLDVKTVRKFKGNHNLINNTKAEVARQHGHHPDNCYFRTKDINETNRPYTFNTVVGIGL
jgi:hypothetical protein